MPYPSRDPGANPHVDRGFRYQPGGGFGTTVQVRNGMPDHKPYGRTSGEDAETAAAERAWHQVALIQARLRGEPPPAPIAMPWTKGACPGCGYRMRCGCPPRTVTT